MTQIQDAGFRLTGHRLETLVDEYWLQLGLPLLSKSGTRVGLTSTSNGRPSAGLPPKGNRIRDHGGRRRARVSRSSGRQLLGSGAASAGQAADPASASEVLLEAAVPGGVAEVTVWTDDPANPDEVVIAVG